MDSSSTTVPFAEDEDEDASLYSMDSPSSSSSSDDGRYGPDGDGEASDKSGSAMPQYSPAQSGGTNPENNAPANSGGKSAGADPLGGSLYEPPPTAPQYKPIDRSRRDADEAALTTDMSAPNTGKPSVFQRISGALAGISDSFAHRPDSGTEDAILNRNHDQFAAKQQQKVAADRQRLTADQQGITDQTTDQENERKLYDTSLQGYKAQQEAQGAQWTRNHTLQADQTANQHWTAEDQERRDQNLYTHTHDDAVSAETMRHNKATENNSLGDMGLRSREVSVQEQRLRDDEAATAAGKPGSPANQRLVAQDAAKYQSTRQDAFNKINNGDPKAADENSQRGYKATLKDLGTRPDNPETGEPWKPGEREDAIQQLQQQHLDDLNKVETDYVDNMHGIGMKDIQPIKFNDQGEATTDSNGRPLQRQQVGAPAAGNPGQPGAAKPSAAVPAPGNAQPQTQAQVDQWVNNPTGTEGLPRPTAPVRPSAQQAAPPAAAPPARPAPAPQAMRTKSGKTVTIGQMVSIGGKTYRVTGFNPKTGKPMVSQ